MKNVFKFFLSIFVFIIINKVNGQNDSVNESVIQTKYDTIYSSDSKIYDDSKGWVQIPLLINNKNNITVERYKEFVQWVFDYMSKILLVEEGFEDFSINKHDINCCRNGERDNNNFEFTIDKFKKLKKSHIKKSKDFNDLIISQIDNAISTNLQYRFFPSTEYNLVNVEIIPKKYTFYPNQFSDKVYYDNKIIKDQSWMIGLSEEQVAAFNNWHSQKKYFEENKKKIISRVKIYREPIGKLSGIILRERNKNKYFLSIDFVCDMPIDTIRIVKFDDSFEFFDVTGFNNKYICINDYENDFKELKIQIINSKANYKGMFFEFSPFDKTKNDRYGNMIYY